MTGPRTDPGPSRLVMTWAATGGGAARVSVTLANGLAAAGHRITAVLPQTQGHYIDQLRVAELVEIGSRAPHRVIAGLVRVLRRQRPTTLLSGQQQMNVAALLAIRAVNPRPRAIIVQHNQLSAVCAADPRLRFMPTLARWLYPQADEIVGVSHGVADDLARVLAMRRDRIRVIYNPVVTPDLEELAQKIPDDLWPESDQIPRIIAVGRLAPQKDYATLVQALALVERRRRVQLTILGGGRQNEREALQTLAGRVGATVTLAGHVQNPYAYLARAAMLVMSSRWEGLPTVLVEALACGCPVVATDCPSGPREILEGGRYGRLVPVGDPEALAQAIVATLDAPPAPETLKRRAADFSMETAIDAYSALITTPSKRRAA